MKYKVYRTDTADALIRNIVLYIAENFGNEIALGKLDDLEKAILKLEDNPYIGTEPRYTVLKRQGYKVLILEKDLVFYKIDENRKVVTVYFPRLPHSSGSKSHIIKQCFRIPRRQRQDTDEHQPLRSSASS